MKLDCCAGGDGLDWRDAVGPAEVFVRVVDCGDRRIGWCHFRERTVRGQIFVELEAEKLGLNSL